MEVFDAQKGVEVGQKLIGYRGKSVKPSYSSE